MTVSQALDHSIVGFAGRFLPILILILAVEVALPILFFLGRDRLIFLPSVHPGPEEGLFWFRGGVDARVVRIERPDGRRLAAYDARPADADRERLPVVIFLHGNAGNIAHRAYLLDAFVRGTETRTVLIDYSGYGGNEGSPSEAEVYRDGLAAYDHIVSTGVAADRIVLYGESLGSAVALAVAADRPVAGIVVQSGFSTASSMALRIYPWMPLTALLARGSFPNLDRLQQISAPLLIVHGRRDKIVPFAEGKRLHSAAPAGTEFLAIEGAGHNDLFEVAGPDYLESLGEYFRAWTITADRTP